MVHVAIAGGTSPTLGRSLVTAIRATTPKHHVIILSRRNPNDENLPTHKYGAEIHYVDYSAHFDLSVILRMERIHTLISVMKSTDPDEMQSVHRTLLRAAIASGQVRRFVPSDWSMGPLSHQSVDMLAHKETLLHDAQRLVKECNADIDVCTFQNGMFMEYLAQKLPRPDEPCGMSTRSDALLSGLQDDLMLEYIDIAKGILPVPTCASGKPARITTTSIRDVGRFVAAALDLESRQWEGCMGIKGVDVTFQEIKDMLRNTAAPQIEDGIVTREMCEEKGKNFEMELSNGFSLNAFLGRMVAQMVAASCDGKEGEGIVEGKVNRLLAERGLDVEARDIGEYLKEVWGNAK
jgi:hypothetical protein